MNCPLHENTKGLVSAELLKKFKKVSSHPLPVLIQTDHRYLHIIQGSWLVNTARGAICDADAVKAAVASGHLLGYAGDGG